MNKVVDFIIGFIGGAIVGGASGLVLGLLTGLLLGIGVSIFSRGFGNGGDLIMGPLIMCGPGLGIGALTGVLVGPIASLTKRPIFGLPIGGLIGYWFWAGMWGSNDYLVLALCLVVGVGASLVTGIVIEDFDT